MRLQNLDTLLHVLKIFKLIGYSKMAQEPIDFLYKRIEMARSSHDLYAEIIERYCSKSSSTSPLYGYIIIDNALGL